MGNSDTVTEQNTDSIDWKHWLSLFKPWVDVFHAADTEASANENKGGARGADSVQATLKMWQTLMGAVSEPTALQHFQKAMEITPDIASGFTQACLESFTIVQVKTGDWIKKRGRISPQPIFSNWIAS